VETSVVGEFPLLTPPVHEGGLSLGARVVGVEDVKAEVWIGVFSDGVNVDSKVYSMSNSLM
jgi:hypothetical protein